MIKVVEFRQAAAPQHRRAVDGVPKFAAIEELRCPGFRNAFTSDSEIDSWFDGWQDRLGGVTSLSMVPKVYPWYQWRECRGDVRECLALKRLCLACPGIVRLRFPENFRGPMYPAEATLFSRLQTLDAPDYDPTHEEIVCIFCDMPTLQHLHIGTIGFDRSSIFQRAPDLTGRHPGLAALKTVCLDGALPHALDLLALRPVWPAGVDLVCHGRRAWNIHGVGLGILAVAVDLLSKWRSNRSDHVVLSVSSVAHLEILDPVMHMMGEVEFDGVVVTPELIRAFVRRPHYTWLQFRRCTLDGDAWRALAVAEGCGDRVLHFHNDRGAPPSADEVAAARTRFKSLTFHTLHIP